ncbi:MAG: hypothetical protein JXB49_02035 [Bacteroidales bacterium]|nr:hypothetical protein [Bacteroidales bacterium]
MKRNILLILIGLYIYSYNIKSQDYIIVSESSIEALTGEIILFESNYILFKETNASDPITININNVLSCNFYKAEDEIIIPKITYDTIRCWIDSINRKEIYYTDIKTWSSKSINKSGVFICGFENTINDPRLLVYKEKYEASLKLLMKKENYLITMNDKRRDVNIISVKDSIINIEIVNNDKIIKTNITKDKVKSIVFNVQVPDTRLKTSKNYILRNSGQFDPYMISAFDKENIYLNAPNSKGELVKTLITKKDALGILFTDLSEPEIKNTTQTIQGNSEYPKIKLNIQGSYGYIYPKSIDDIPQELESYMKEIRSGFGAGADVTFYLNELFGMGPSFRYFRTKNSINNLQNVYINTDQVTSTSDDIKLFFIGLDFMFRTQDIGGFYYENGISPGIMFKKNDAAINHFLYTQEGKTFGLKITNRFNFTDQKHIGIFLELSGVFGGFKEYEIEGQTVKLDEPDNNSRIDVGIGIKFF